MNSLYKQFLLIYKMYIYSINIWQQQNYTFIYRFKTINSINMFILYIKKKYQVYTTSINKNLPHGGKEV